jgi:mevalonate kinase
MKTILKARSPAKLILSGEHAVVYGKPAIAMAINRYAESTITSQISTVILFNLLNLHYVKPFTLQTLIKLKQRLHKKYGKFLLGHKNISDVLKKPFELLQYTVSNLLDKLDIKLTQGIEISASSEIPIGCGMGSSAALVMSTLYALAHFLKLDMDPARFLSLGREAENLQHGYSSGLDLQLAMSGGCIRFQAGQLEKRIMPNFPFQIVQTGTPKASTGQCVAAVADNFKNSTIFDDFEKVTNIFDAGLMTNDLDKICSAIRQNHALLMKIGVVPDKVGSFIEEIERLGGAAKICGAGSVLGDNAGIVLIHAEKDISSVLEKYNYTAQNVTGDTRGTHLI